MEHKAADKFFSCNSHLLDLVMVGIVPPTKCDFIILKRQNPIVGNSHAMCVAA